MALDEVAVGAVAEAGGGGGGVDDVGEEDGGEGAVGLVGAAAADEELLDLVEEGVLVADPGEVVGAVEEDEAGAGDGVGEVTALGLADDEVVAAVEDEGRRRDGGEDGPDIDFTVEVDEVHGAGRARALAQEARPPGPEGGLPGGAGRPDLGPDRAAPPLADHLAQPVEAPRLDPGRMVVRHEHPRPGAVEDERRDPLRVAGGEERRHRPALGDAHDRPAPAAGRVHHRPHVVHRLLQGRRPPRPIGEALAALVEDDQPREGGEAAQEPRDLRLLPDQLDVGDEPGDEHEVQRPLAVDLVGNAGPGGIRVVRGRFHRDPPAA